MNTTKISVEGTLVTEVYLNKDFETIAELFGIENSRAANIFRELIDELDQNPPQRRTIDAYWVADKLLKKTKTTQEAIFCSILHGRVYWHARRTS